MQKHKYTGKTKVEAVKKAQEELQELEKNLYIKETSTQKASLFKSAKVEIEVVEKSEVLKYIKEYIISVLNSMGFKVQVEVKNKETTPCYVIYSENDALLIGKNGKNLKALNYYVGLHLNKELGKNIKFTLDINDYNKKREKRLENLAKRVAKEVALTKIEAKLEYMNSYERRIIHNILGDNKSVYTQSEGVEPHRFVVIKPKED